MTLKARLETRLRKRVVGIMTFVLTTAWMGVFHDMFDKTKKYTKTIWHKLLMALALTISAAILDEMFSDESSPETMPVVIDG